MFSITFQRKDARSGGTPGCLQIDQEIGQSVSGLSSSDLHFLISLLFLSMLGSMVMYSSVNNLDQSFSVMVMMLMEDSSWTFFTMENIS